MGVNMEQPVVMRDCGSRQELEELWDRWQSQSESLKLESDRKSVELYGMDNQTHHGILQLLYV